MASAMARVPDRDVMWLLVRTRQNTTGDDTALADSGLSLFHY